MSKKSATDISDRTTPEAFPRELLDEPVSEAPVKTHAEIVEDAQKAAALQTADAERAVIYAGGVPTAEPVTTLAPRITVEQFARRQGRSTVVAIFAAEDVRHNGARKLDESEWSSLFDAFQKKPR